ncbi:MAG: glycosyltransferase, partial [Atribacterota bacterium]
IRPDIVHLHSSKAGLLGRIAGKLALIKNIIYQPHGPVFYGYFGKIKNKLIIMIERLTAHLCDRIVFLTPSSQKDYQDKNIGRRKQYRVIQNGVDVDIFHPPTEEEKEENKFDYDFRKEDVVLGMVGRIVDIKGHKYFVEAFEDIAKKFDNVKGLIVGEGEYSDKIKKMVKEKNLQDRIIFTGFVENVPKIMRTIDVLVQPSVVEGFGIAIVEAGACCVPAVGFRIGGIQDIIIENETGILVELKNSKELAKCLEFLALNPSKIKDLGEKARKHIIDNYTLDKMMYRLVSMYNELQK